MGEYTIEKDPTRDAGLRIVMGPFTGTTRATSATVMTTSTPCPRQWAAFRLQVRPELLTEYRDHHAAVWPEMRAALERCGWHNCSLFLDEDGTLFGYVETPGPLAEAITAMQSEPVNERWQALMAPYFVAGDRPADQQMTPLTEVSHLP